MAEAQNWRCCYCGYRMEGSGSESNAPSFEHVTPIVLGGMDDDDNIAIACRGCNERRGGAHSE
jgi:5-methylcytosine-specific restriction endonuclease McrA